MPIVSIHQRGYTYPELLAETDWLAEHGDDSNVRIVDARPPQQYAAGHIPGAVNLRAQTEFRELAMAKSRTRMSLLWSPASLASAMMEPL